LNTRVISKILLHGVSVSVVVVVVVVDDDDDDDDEKIDLT